MKKLSFYLIILFSFLISGTTNIIHANLFTFTNGAREFAMGSASVSTSYGVSSIINNPSALVLFPKWQFYICYSQENLMGENLDELLKDINSFNISEPDFYSNEKSVYELVKRLEKLNKYQALTLYNQQQLFFVGNDKFAFGYQMWWTKIAFPEIDLISIAPVEPEDENSIANNNSYIRFLGIKASEFIISNAYLSANKKASFGTNIKYQMFSAYESTIPLWDIKSFDLSSEMDKLDREIDEKSSSINFDLSLTFYSQSGRLSFSAIDLKKAKIKLPDGDYIKLNPKFRIGYALIPAPDSLIAIDYDLNKSYVKDESYYSRYLSIGMEQWFGKTTKWLSLRIGAKKNLSWDYSTISYSFGIGLKIKHLTIDASAQSDFKTKNVDFASSISIFI